MISIEEAALRGRIKQLEALNAELVEALEDMVEIVADIPHYAGRARAAIAKATGVGD